MAEEECPTCRRLRRLAVAGALILALIGIVWLIW